VGLTLFAQNLLESATVTATIGDLTPLARLYDRDLVPYQPAFPQTWTLTDLAPLPLALGGPALAQVDYPVDMGSPKPVSYWAGFRHNLAGITLTLYGDNFSPPTTPRDSFTATGADFARIFAELTLRYWTVRVPAMAAPPFIGELMLGVPRTLSRGPFHDDSAFELVPNVGRDLTPAGHGWGYRRGPRRVSLPYSWPALRDEDRLSLIAALDDIGDGAKNLPIVDGLGTLRWVTWLVGDRLRFEPSVRNAEGRHWRFATVFEEAL
jgi:hypothetical protein